MANEERLPHWRAELIASLEQLGALGAELRDDGPEFEADALAEADELLRRASRAVEELSARYPRLEADELRTSPARGIDTLSVVYTVGITTLVLPFVQTLAQRAGEDAYRALCRIIGRHGRSSRRNAEPGRVVLGDRETDVRVAIDSRVDAAALAALQQVDFADESLQEATLRWNPDRSAWETEPGRARVSLWLPGDPLDEDWDRNRDGTATSG
ncbi:hypothetical protein [Streptomyces sp. NBC_00588]|uniref:hypothetical protein n=1 Tax=Streptomyces sp. NBC_00588 TaxID=2975784 RepID=UPI002E8237EB|nr:hypothetical protein [Streptomyces sp. NBC_00588]WUB35340.1 hypothetical protein OHN38_10630 [Streptomyces sp. NBC_00588]